jgi:branched-chain amino acid transport system permease protein
VWRRAGFAALIALALGALLADTSPYAIVLMIDILITVLFAASLHFLMGPAGMHSFGHAAYFGLGAYGAALCFKALGLPMEASLVLAPLLAALGAFVFGWFCVRLSGVYLAMLTLAFAQIVWSVVFQWDALTGGSNGLVGIWPSPWLAPRAAYYLLTLACTVAGCGLIVRMLHAPIGLALRGSRDSPIRAAAIGIRVPRLQWLAFVVAGTVAGLAGSLFAFAKGTISPETLGVGKSVDGLVMVLLGGVQSLSGPWVGAALFTWLQDTVARQTDYWRALLGVAMLALVLVFPLGVAGGLKRVFIREAA